MMNPGEEPLFHVEFPPNELGRDFIVGDIHGAYDELFRLLEDHDFNCEQDRLFSVGDLIDRGARSVDIVALTKEPWFFTVQGNHEQMMIDAISGGQLSLWLANGGDWFLEVDHQTLRNSVDTILELPMVITVNHKSGKRVGICHAQPPVDHWSKICDVENDSQAQREMIWSRSRALYRDMSIVEGTDWIFCGHTPLKIPTILGNTVYVDTGAFLEDGYMTIINIGHFIEHGLSKAKGFTHGL